MGDYYGLHKIMKPEFENLKVGDEIIYFNKDDVITGAIYRAKIIEKYTNIILMVMTIFEESIEHWGMLGATTETKTSFSKFDLYDGSLQMIFKQDDEKLLDAEIIEQIKWNEKYYFQRGYREANK